MKEDFDCVQMKWDIQQEMRRQDAELARKKPGVGVGRKFLPIHCSDPTLEIFLHTMVCLLAATYRRNQ